MKTFLQKNKALLILPLGLLPFVVLIFYILGGGQQASLENSQDQARSKHTNGVNYQLPEADQAIEIFDKMEAYQQSKMPVNRSRDYWNTGADTLALGEAERTGRKDSSGRFTGIHTEGSTPEAPGDLLDHIRQKEKQVRAELEGKEPDPKARRKTKASEPYRLKLASGRNETIPIALPQTGIEELDHVFDENLALSRQNDSLAYHLKQANRKLNTLEAKQTARFKLEKTSHPGFGDKTNVDVLVRAEVYESATVLSGNRVKLRLLEDCRIGAETVSKGTFIYGICRVKNERLQIDIRQLPTQAGFLPVDLAIYDLDGLEGLYVPDNVARKVIREVGGSTNTSSLFGVTADPLTYAGVRAADKTAQTLFKRVRLKKVTVKKNTLVYLINQK